MTIDPRASQRFLIGGTVEPLVKARDMGWMPTRPLGGWLIVYGLLAKGGSVQPVIDRQDQVFAAARRPDGIDASEYLSTGYWNDSHRKDPEFIVGRPTELSFHGAASDLAKAHGKVGWWTEGHLIDRADPVSWSGLPGGKPSEASFERADRFWKMARLLKGVPRSLGLSAEGVMALTPDRKTVVWAQLQRAAVCELPVNPATTVEPMALAIQAMAKAMTSDSMSDVVPEDLEGGGPDPDKIDRLVQSIVQRNHVTEAVARRWVTKWLRKVRGSEV